MSRFALFALLFAACATPTAMAPGVDGPSEFTTVAQLEKIRAAPVPAAPTPDTVATVTEWTLGGPFPEVASHEPHPNGSAFDAHVLTVTQGQIATSADMACVARETARFVAAKKARPPQALERFIAGRCGATAARVETTWISGKSDGSDDALAAAWAPRIDNLLTTLRRGGVAGSGFHREGDEAVWAVAWSKESLELADVALAPKDGKVRVEVKAQNETLEVSGLINQGEYAVARCEVDPSVAPPKFALDCPTDGRDEHEWISVDVRETGALTGSEEARVLAMPRGGKSLEWRARDSGGATLLTPATLLQQLNVARAKVGAPPATLAEAESTRLDALAPHYFAALRGGDTALQHEIALGVMGGWGAGQPIAHGAFCEASAERAEAGPVMAELLDRPRDRAALLDPSVTLVSAAVNGADALLGAFVTVPALTANERVRKVITELDAGRVKRSVHPVNWVVPQAQVSEDQLEKLAKGNGDPNAALDEMLQIAHKQLKVEAHGWQLAREDLSGFHFPKELLTEQPLDVWVVVTPYRPKNHPWTRWAVLMVSLSGNLKQVTGEAQ
ncbi:MAG: hypothetical protein QM723_23415 [Myxococcaceae bacterium]